MKINFSAESLPPPVKKYFMNVMKEGEEVLKYVHLEQKGLLRSSPKNKHWMSFTANHNISALHPDFLWNAKIKIAPFIYINVIDRYLNNEGSSKLSLFSFLLKKSENGLEMNSGSLHRYLAEAVWYPTALLPQNGIKWTSIDDHRALATLSNAQISVSLEFRFNDQGEVVGIFSPNRWGTFKDGFKQKAWEGFFSDYFIQDNFRIPSKGEVGWYERGSWKSVWKGEIVKAIFNY